jgi:DNA-binding NtrC family response regulator
MVKDNRRESILVVDDAVNTLEVIERNLASRGYNIYTAREVDEALRILEKAPIDLVVTDYKMPWVSGLDLIRHVRENYRDIEVVMITGYASIPGAVEAVKSGAIDYLAKPFTEEELFGTVEKALEKLHSRKAPHQQADNRGIKSYGLIGNSKPMLDIFRTIEKTASTSATVLISGESGTGKELVARAIHYQSARASASFVPVNCGGIPESLLESELFGHVKGSFTGAIETRAGFFQTADGGTIFLDEISETSLAMQVKLLRILQDKQVCMVGDTRSREVDIRILAATNRDLRNLVQKGLFRNDLYFRVSVITITVPPLRERGNDIFLLVSQFAEKFSKELDKPAPRFSDAALEVLKNYNWPGNVRELENVIQRLVVMMESDFIDVPDLPDLMRFTAMRKTGLNRTLSEIEESHIKDVLIGVRGNKTKAAGILGIDRKTLREKLKKFKDKH